MLERVYQNQKIRPVVYPFAKQPWVANGQTGRKKGQGEIEKPPFIFGETLPMTLRYLTSQYSSPSGAMAAKLCFCSPTFWTKL
jgi:hypothetical protein